ncbi:MAG: hypothetical protein M1834_007728 [Cirrosporium novae-zelandiae]|nr:MAG: hypothetical protein M1834_007728 [Cirrosporium novae-zelandiae]
MAEKYLAEVSRFKDQYLQLFDPDLLIFPPPELLKKENIQNSLYSEIFKEGSLIYEPPPRYKFRVLKDLMTRIENAITDPEEDEISDELMSLLTNLLAERLPSELDQAQRQSYVTYTVPKSSLNEPSNRVTILESRNLIATSGGTGYRTWEAALHLANYICSSEGKKSVKGKNILELGAGTGLLSITATKCLGAKFVLATDGDDNTVDNIGTNIILNNFGCLGIKTIEAATLKWGMSLDQKVKGACDSYDIVLGADITYDLRIIPLLVSTLRDLFDEYPNIEVLISATVRKEETVACFVKACETNEFLVKSISRDVPPLAQQSGLFYTSTVPIRIFSIRRLAPKKDPFAI